MRIVLLLTAGVDRPIGARYLPICAELVRRGHQVRILALHPDLPNCPQRRFTRDGIEVWYVGQMHARKQSSLPSRFSPLELLWVLITSTLGMIWGILRSPADVYHLGKPQPVNGLAALIGVMLLRRQRFYVDCDDDEVLSNRLTAKWQRAVFGFWQWLLPRLAAGVTVNTQFLAERMRQANLERVAYVPNGARFVQLTDAPVRDALRRALGLEQRPVIAYAGTLALQNHPVDLLIAAFAIVAERLPNAVLLMIGGGEDLPLLRERVAQLGLADRVYFTGQLPRSVLPNYLALADISVDPVRDDVVARARSPLKIFESMVLGVPVVTADVGDRAAMLDHGRAGVLVPADDHVALAEALIDVLRDRARLEALSKAAIEHSKSYTWDQLVSHWEALYHSSP